jgi:hypothetical protein
MKKILLFLLPRGTRALHRDLIIKFVEGCNYRYVCPQEDALAHRTSLFCPYSGGEGCPFENLYLEKTTRRYSWCREVLLKPHLRISYDRTFKRMRELGLIALADPTRYGYFYNLTKKGMKMAKKIKNDVEDFIGNYKRFLQP